MTGFISISQSTNHYRKNRAARLEFLLVSGGRSHLLMVLQEPLKCLFGLLVFDSGLLFLFLLRLYFVGIEGLFLLTQFGKGTLKIF